MKLCHVICSYCGKQVSNAVESYLDEGMVVRAIVICPECQVTTEKLENDTNNPNVGYLKDHHII